MYKIKIITDSGSDITEKNSEYLTVLPMTIRFGESEYRDGVDITHREFYEKLVESDELPVTSLVSPAAFEDAYKEAVVDGYKLIVITISSKLSGTYQSAVLAASEYPDNVFVVDSKNVSVGEQILVNFALELLTSGMSAEEIAHILEEEREKIHIIALLDTLEYLKKGGRISKTTAFVGGMLSIKPVVTVSDGEVEMLGKARGSKNGSNFLIADIKNSPGIDFSKPIGLGYTGLSDNLLQKYIQDSEELWRGHEDSLNISSIGATIGTHIGPDAIAVAFFSK